MEKISVIISCYNEEKALPLFYDELIKNIKSFPKTIDFEIIRSLEKQEDVKDCEKKKVKRK